MRRLVEEKGSIKIPSGSAPLADQEVEEEDDDVKPEEEERAKEKEERLLQTEKLDKMVAEIKAGIQQQRRISHQYRTRSFPNLPCIGPSTIPTVVTSSSCPDSLDRPRDTQAHARCQPRKTASAPSIAEEDVGRIDEPDKTITTGSVVKKPTVAATPLRHRISPPAYLSPQPSRVLRRLRQSSFVNTKVRPTSVSVSSMEHELQKLSRMCGSVCSGAYGPPPWARQSTTDLPPTPQVHVNSTFFLFLNCTYVRR